MFVHDAYMQGKAVEFGVVLVFEQGEQEELRTPALQTCTLARTCCESWCVPGHVSTLNGVLMSCVQDNVPAFPSSEAVAIIERNLGGKLLDKYESFTMEPIAAASLGQVTTRML